MLRRRGSPVIQKKRNALVIELEDKLRTKLRSFIDAHLIVHDLNQNPAVYFKTLGNSCQVPAHKLEGIWRGDVNGKKLKLETLVIIADRLNIDIDFEFDKDISNASND